MQVWAKLHDSLRQGRKGREKGVKKKKKKQNEREKYDMKVCVTSISSR